MEFLSWLVSDLLFDRAVGGFLRLLSAIRRVVAEEPAGLLLWLVLGCIAAGLVALALLGTRVWSWP